VDVSSARNNFGGRYNAPNYPNIYAFATFKADGSIVAWASLLLMMVCKFELVALAVLSLALESD
jgi:hypothetical protein